MQILPKTTPVADDPPIGLAGQEPARAVLGTVPVAPDDTLAQLQAEVDDIVCLATPEPFRAVGLHYDDFHQLEDAEVVRALAASDKP